MLPPVHYSGDGMMMIMIALMFSLLQNVLNLSKIKLPPESDIIFLGKPYSEKNILHVSISLLSSWWQGMCCDNLQYKSSFYCVMWTYLHQLSSMVGWGFVVYYLFFRLCLLKIKTYRAIFMCFSVSSLIFVQQIDSCVFLEFSFFFHFPHG